MAYSLLDPSICCETLKISVKFAVANAVNVDNSVHPGVVDVRWLAMFIDQESCAEVRWLAIGSSGVV